MNAATQGVRSSSTTESGLPEGWAVARIDDMFESFGGMTPSTADPAYWNGKVPWISSKDVKEWRIKGGTDYITQKALQDTRLRLCPKGSVLVVVRSGILAHTLPVATTDSEVTINQDLKALFSSESSLNDWLALSLRALAPEILAKNRKDGTTVQSIRFEQLKNMELPVPPLAEQNRIMSQTEALLARVNAARERLDKVPAILKRFRQSVLAAACSGELTEEWRRTQAIPTWPLDNLGATGVRVQIGPFGSLLHQADYVPSGIPLVNPMHIKEGRIVPSDDARVLPLKLEELSLYRLNRGDVVLGRRGEMGRAAVVRDSEEGFLCGTGSLFLRSEPDRWIPGFLCLVLRSPQTVATLGEAAVGSTMINLNRTIVAELPVPVVPVHEQREIVLRVEALFGIANEIGKRVESAKSHVERLTKAILAKAFRGELVPTEAELARREGRDFEPASALLARIKHQRGGQAGEALEAGTPQAAKGKGRARRSVGSTARLRGS